MRADPANPRRRRFSLVSRPGAIAAIFVLATAAGLAAVAGTSSLFVVLDLVAALLIVAPAVLAGFWAVPLFRLGPLPLRWHVLLGAGLGVGGLSTLMLVLGSLGLVDRALWVGIIAGLAAAGVVRLKIVLSRFAHDESASRPSEHNQRAGHWLWLLVVPFLVLALLAAATPPGLSWSEEGLGYDVLEYHLQLPKEYLQNGRITYLRHNVYGSFPSNVEMLYMAAMIVHGNAYDVATVANMMHLILGALFVFGAWLLGREWGAFPGVASGVIVGTSGWLVYLSGLAYVEHGLLFFGVVATGAVVRLVQCAPSGSANRIGWAAVGGLAGGFACGCKYTGALFVALPLAVAIAMAMEGRLRRRLAAVIVFGVGALVAFAPWMVKNAAATGNPLFPLMGSVIQGYPAGWSKAQSDHWDEAHGAAAERISVGEKGRALWRHIPGDPLQRFQWAAILLGLVALWRRPGRIELALGVVLFLQILFWLMVTHLYARFAAIILLPLALLAGRTATEPSMAGHEVGARPGRGVAHKGRRYSWFLTAPAGERWRVLIVASIIIAASAWSAVGTGRLFAREWPGVVPASVIYNGELPGSEYLGFVNERFPPGAKILLCGEARAFYFQREFSYWTTFNWNPFYEALQGMDPEEAIRWLKGNRYTHVLVNWSEVRRLERTYESMPPMTEERLAALLARLVPAGLRLIRVFPDPRDGMDVRYVDIFEIAPGNK